MNYVHTFCDNPAMDETMGDRLRAARIKAGFPSARQAALRNKLPPSTYAAHENGQNDFGPADADLYAKAFKTTAAWLLTAEGPSTVGGNRKTKLLGEVGAGSVVEPFDDGYVEEIDLPPGAPLGAVAVRVRGSSMYPRYFDGERLFYVKDGRSPAELMGKECIIRLKSGGMLVKIIRPGTKKGHFTLESWSHDPLQNQAIDWAAPVRWTERV